MQTEAQPTPPRSAPSRRGRGRDIALGCGISLVLLLLLMGAGWVVVLRPALHAFAVKQLDRALSTMASNVPLDTVPSSGASYTLYRETFHQQIDQYFSPSHPIQQVSTSITPEQIRVRFMLAGFENAVSVVPTIEQGRLTASSVQVEGVVGWIMSADELTPILTTFFSTIQKRMGRTITGVKLQDERVVFLLKQ